MTDPYIYFVIVYSPYLKTNSFLFLQSIDNTNCNGLLIASIYYRNLKHMKTIYVCTVFLIYITKIKGRYHISLPISQDTFYLYHKFNFRLYFLNRVENYFPRNL